MYFVDFLVKLSIVKHPDKRAVLKLTGNNDHESKECCISKYLMQWVFRPILTTIRETIIICPVCSTHI